MTNTLSIIIAAALVNNLILVQLLGVSSLFYATRRLSQAMEFALFNFAILFLASTANLILYRFLLEPLQLEILRLVLFVMISALLTTAVLQILTKQLPLTVRQQGLLIFLTGGNSAVLGIGILNTAGTLTLAEGIATSFGSALGFSLMLIGFAALRARLETADIPAPFRGSPIALITAGLVTISLLGFAGLT